MKNFTILFLSLFSTIIFAQKQYLQHSPKILIYKLTAEEAKDILTDKNYSFQIKETYLDQVFDSLHWDEKPDLPVGHFLMARAVQDDIEFEYISQNSISAKVLNNERDLQIQVIDSSGQLIDNAIVTLNKKEIPFHEKTKTYRLKKWNKAGFLTIKTDSETAFYEIERERNGSIFFRKIGYFSNSKFGKIVTFPVRIPVKIGKKIYNYFERGFKWNEWRIRFRNPFQRYHDKNFKGYLVFNKPKYLPNDTVKMKAFITNHRGKAIKQDLRLEIKENYRKTVFKTMVSPNSKGNFEYEFVLGDSLKLDKKYSVYFKHPKKSRSLSHHFYYEDYQLDKLTFSFKSDKKEYQKGDKIILFAEGKDKNNLTIPDGEIQLNITRKNALKFLEDEVLIPDTLWTHRQLLNPREETQIIVPDSIFPPANLEVLATAILTNSSGETHTKTANFKVIRAIGNLVMKIENGEFITEYFEDGKSIQSIASLTKKGEKLDNLEKKMEIHLPYREKLNPFISSYLIENTTQKESLILLNYENRNPNINLQTSRTADSIFVQFSNPNQLPINYFIHTKNREIVQVYSDSSQIIWQKAMLPNEIVYLKYNYVWGGKIYDKEKEIRAYKNLLNIEIEQPENIMPGETIPVKIRVQDYKNRAAKKVNLAAGAVNSEFEKTNNLRAPEISYKRKREPFFYNEFSLKKPKEEKTWERISKKWRQKFQLDTLLYYQLLNPEKGLHFHYDTIQTDSFYQNIAQFAPYLTKNGKWQPIYMIYCNEKLVYWYDVDDHPRYSFIGREGYNRITVRGREWEYQIDSVWLEKGKKLEFSLDADFVGKNVKKHFIGKKLTVQERAIIEGSIFMLRTSPSLTSGIWQNDRIHLFSNPPSYFKVGPFTANGTDSLTFKNQAGWQNTFYFESGFRYDILPKRERLYQYSLSKEWKKKELPSLYQWQGALNLGELTYSVNDTKKFLKPIEKKSIAWTRSFKIKDGGDCRFDLPKDSLFLAYIFEENDSTSFFINPSSKNIKNLKPANYTVHFFTPFGNYIKKEVQIQANTLRYQNLENHPFQKDSANQIFNKFYARNKTLFHLNKPTKKFPSSDMIQRFSGYSSGLTGTVTEEETGDPVIFGNVVAMQNGVVLTGTETDFDGNYSLPLPPGVYDIEVHYIGFPTKRIEGVIVSGLQKNRLDVKLSGGIELEEVVVVGYSIERKELIPSVSADKVLSSQQIKNLPTRNINALVGVVSGVNIRGSRTNATKYYIDGQRVSGKSNNPNQSLNLLSGNTIRSKFSDYAFWQPNLITDQNGETYFNATFPDNITSWKTFAVGMDNKNRGGVAFSETRAFKKLMAQLAVPRFLIEGDKTEIIGKSINYTNDSFEIQTYFQLFDERVQTKIHQIAEAVIEKREIEAETLDSLKLTYALQMGDYGDGEQRNIPVFRKGVKETVGEFHILEGDTSIVFEPQKDLGKVTIFAMTDELDLMLKSIEYLKNYPYGCNEQTASRLLALLMEKEIREHLDQDFEYEKDIQKAIARLKKTQNEDGSWGWWFGGKRNFWMTNYVLKALLKAYKKGYKTTAFEKGWRFLANNIQSFQNKDLLNALDLLSQTGQNIDYQLFISKIDTILVSQFDQFLITKIRQENDLNYSLDSLFKYQKQTTFGGLFWGSEGYGFYNNTIQNTLLAYQILKEEGREDLCKKIRRYFLQKQRTSSNFRNGRHSPFRGLGGNFGGARNTYETAQILQTILPDILKENQNRKAQLQLPNGEIITNFPVNIQMPFEQFRNNFVLKKSGGSELYLSLSQTFHNENPKPKSDLFEIKTNFLKNGELVKNSKLETGQKTKLRVDLTIKESADYVMIEVPIPAGCSYERKSNSRRFPEVHREYFKEKVAIFCEELPVGDYRFEIDLEPRFSGTYTLNPAKVEQMYFPIFFGRNELKKMKVD